MNRLADRLDGIEGFRGASRSPIRTFEDGDETPSVGDGIFFETANLDSTTIRNFDDGKKGQQIWVVTRDAHTTFDFTDSNLFGNGGYDYASSFDDALFGIFDGSNWYCLLCKSWSPM